MSEHMFDHGIGDARAKMLGAFAEQERLLREAFLVDHGNAMGVVDAEIARLRKVADGAHPDERLCGEDARRLAAEELARYETLRREYARSPRVRPPTVD